MKRRLNYTRRRRISSDRVLIRMLDAKLPGSPPSFEASIDLDGLDLPAHGNVFLDPYVNTSSMRFSYGTVGAISSPEDCRLSDIDAGKDVLFRLMVVDDSNEVGKILASTTAISPIGDQNLRQSLLPLKMKNLEEGIWAVDLENDRPYLVLNNRIPGLQEKLFTDPLFRGSIYPHALRMIVRSIYSDSSPSFDEERVEDWKMFVSVLVGDASARDMNENDNVDELVDAVVREFTNRNRYAHKVLFREQPNV
jgi:hypothetical protein